MDPAPRPTARYTAAMFGGAAVLALRGYLFPWPGPHQPSVLLGAAGAAVLFAFAAWRIPWSRASRWVKAAVPPLALGLLAAIALAGGVGPFSFAACFVLVFAWIGMFRPVLASMSHLPLAALLYVVPVTAVAGQAAALQSASAVLTVCVIVGEVVARSMARLHQVRSLDTSRLGDLEALVAAGALLQGEQDPSRLGDLVARLGAAVLGGGRAGVWLVDASGSFVVAGRHGSGSGLRPPPEVLDRAVRTGRLESVEADRGRRLVVAPLTGTAGVLGVLAVSIPRGRDDGFVEHVARLFGSQAGLTVERTRAIHGLTIENRRDPLTGVGNRRRGDELLEDIRPGDAIVLVDLDRFKTVNDVWGHAEGDRVLAALADHLRAGLRDRDAVARWGGEEFVVVLRGAGGRAVDVLDRLRERWNGIEARTTFSAGVAVHVEGDDPEDTLARADRACYDAKRAGRDRVELSARGAVPSES